jgi:hypothetical protein
MDIEQLRKAVEAAGPRAPGRWFSPELREALIRTTHQLWRGSEALADIADALGIHVGTATPSLDEPFADDANEEVITELPSPGLVPLEIPVSSLGGSTLRLTTPDRFVVEGLDAETAAALIRTLR